MDVRDGYAPACGYSSAFPAKPGPWDGIPLLPLHLPFRYVAPMTVVQVLAELIVVHFSMLAVVELYRDIVRYVCVCLRARACVPVAFAPLS